MATDYTDSFGYDPNLPEDIRIIFMWLCQDVAYIQHLWSFYLGLFDNEEYKEVADLVPASFRIMEEALRNDITMSICRIGDPPQTLKKNNLSFQTLIQKCPDINGLKELMSDFLLACEPIQKLRNKRVGHNDLNTRIDPHNNPLPGIGQKNIDEILRIAQKMLNTIIQNYVSAEFYFETIQPGGAKELIYWLKAGKKSHEDRHKQLMRH